MGRLMFLGGIVNIIAGSFILIRVVIVYLGIVQRSWNTLISDLLSLRQITLLETFKLVLFAVIISGGGSAVHHHSNCDNHHNAALFDSFDAE